jgi:glycosyltransferase involved in cell wall biosynthesis
MKLVMTLLVRNEADIVEANLDYHLAQGVDSVIVTDHGSTDGTVALLRKYEQAGVLTLLREQGEGHDQGVRVTRMARLALTSLHADWVINNDADEFWCPLSGSLRDVFAAIPPAYGQLEVQRRNFLPRPDSDGVFYSRLLYRDADSLNPSGLPLEPKVAHRAGADIVVAPGNHSISSIALRSAPADELIDIFHFPMRSYEQFERKVLQTGIGYEHLVHRSPEVGRDQLKLLEVYRQGGLARYYHDAILDDATLQQRLESGSVVLDRRLENFMQRMSGAEIQLERPEGRATRSFITRALDAVEALEDEREVRAQEQTQRTALERQLQARQAELAAVGDALHLLTSSRLVRWSAPLRRVWYRAQQLLPQTR